MMKTYAIILAGGRGSRMQTDTPKQYLDLLGRPLLFYSIKAFADWGVDEIVLVCGEGDENYCRETFVEKYGFTQITQIVVGGKQRYHSVMHGLSVIPYGEGIVMIHDGARAFVDQATITNCYKDAVTYGSGVAAVASKDTIKVVDTDGFVKDTPARSSLYIVQTPQTFQLAVIKAAYERLETEETFLLEKGVQITDDAQIAELYCEKKIKMSAGAYTNIKVTTPEDLVMGEMILKSIL
ncbi:MAG: 2-C-methyl-D-erythritol 4-phosphate cytidylyltransferase [Lachnospiraceae bacterium]|nr:2-C-methyl-D-erythritol 4-phosphate cytidylyltransferase [Lachnospiraceae bacterium]